MLKCLFPCVILISGIVTVVTTFFPMLVAFLVLWILLVCGMGLNELFAKKR
ncbi:MAG: hypothetical protein ACOYL3_10490 [Desulfuromonadaceae bacterium]